MPIIERSFTYRGDIPVSTTDLELAKCGRKTLTIRLGTLSVARSSLALTDRRDSVLVEIVRVESDRPYGELTDEDAVADGLGSKAELDADLAKFYGPIDPMQPVTLIYFRLLDDRVPETGEPNAPA